MLFLEVANEFISSLPEELALKVRENGTSTKVDAIPVTQYRTEDEAIKKNASLLTSYIGDNNSKFTMFLDGQEYGSLWHDTEKQVCYYHEYNSTKKKVLYEFCVAYHVIDHHVHYAFAFNKEKQYDKRVGRCLAVERLLSHSTYFQSMEELMFIKELLTNAFAENEIPLFKREYIGGLCRVLSLHKFNTAYIQRTFSYLACVERRKMEEERRVREKEASYGVY